MFIGENGKNKNSKGYIINKDYKMFTNGVYGMAIGDAVGVPYEFSTRKSMDISPCKDMIGYGTHFVPRGFWSDDTSLAIAELDSLIEHGFNPDNTMKNFVKWFDEGKYACDNYVFDCGVTVSSAINNYKSGLSFLKCGGTKENNNGNGSLMRILPVCLFAFYEYYMNHKNIKECIDYVFISSNLTHNTARCRVACGLYFFIVKGILYHYGTLEERIIFGLNEGFSFFSNIDEYKNEIIVFNRLRDLNKFKRIKRNEIKSGGYVVDSLEAAIWCLLNTSNYKECILKAVNLGSDTDTIACIAGGLAGLAYTLSGIPIDWRLIVDYEYLDDICEKADSKYEVK